MVDAPSSRILNTTRRASEPPTVLRSLLNRADIQVLGERP